MTYHTLIGFCGWDIPAAIILVATVAFLAVKHRKLKKMEEELEERVLNLANEEAAQ